MKKFTPLLICMVFAGFTMTAKAVNVTFQVNMNDVADMHPGGSVWLLIGDWDPYFYMDDSDTDGIYTYTLDTTALDTFSYSFSYQTGPDEWSDFVQEAVPDGCANADGYREVIVPASDTTLPAYYYETCSDLLMVGVTFSVDLRGISDLYEDGGVWIYTSTDWADWADMYDEDGDSIYSATVETEADSTLPYIFSYQTGPDSWNDYTYESLPGGCGNVDGFRELLVPKVDTVLTVFPYDSCTGKNMVNYQVNMSGVNDLYEGGAVWLVFGAWDSYFYMEDPDNNSIYSLTLETVADTTIPYYFSYQNGATEDDYAEETVPVECADAEGYRELTIEDGYTVLPAVAFSSCTAAPPKMVKITFSVDMSSVTVENNDVQVVIKDPWIWTALADQGSGIWTGTVEVDPDGTYPYTFVNGGKDNWSGEETVPAECNMGSAGAPERHISVTDKDTILSVVDFGGCNTDPVEKTKVTFNVDLRGVADMYEDGGVWIYTSIDWADWATMYDEDGDSIYSVTVVSEVDSTLPYIFSYQTGPDDWTDYTYETLPGGCANSDGFREMVVPEVDTVLPVFAYDSCVGNNMVNYQVDMSGVNDLYEGGAVWLVFGAWAEYYYMEDADSNNIYSILLETVADTIIPYYFSYQNGPTENDYAEETVPAECADAAGYRTLTIEDGYTVLPAVAYGSCTATPPQMVKITFTVDMSNETVENNDVQVVIKDPWIWTALADQGSGIWSATVEVNASGTYPYTFVNGGEDNWGGEEKLPDECNMGEPGAPERHVTVSDKDTVLSVVAFGSCTAEAGGKVNATFSVDMSYETVSEHGVQLVVKGPWIWTAMVDKGNGLWEVTLPLNENSTYPYTFVNDSIDVWDGEESIEGECNFGTASAPERRLTLGKNDTVLKTVSFGACDLLGEVDVTFRVDMKNETVSGSGVQLILKDDFSWYVMTDAGNGIWETTLTLTGLNSYPYSYVNGAKDYWIGEETIVGDCKDGSNNQRLAQIAGSDTILPAYIFGTCDRTVNVNQVGAEAFTLYPNPVSDHLIIELHDQGVNMVSIYDLTGRIIKNLNIDQENQISVDVSGFSEGIYMVVLKGDRVQAAQRVAVKR